MGQTRTMAWSRLKPVRLDDRLGFWGRDYSMMTRWRAKDSPLEWMSKM